MKKYSWVGILSLVILWSITSCEKCATCTYIPGENGVLVPNDSARTAEVCETGKIYDNAILRYEEAGWVCE